MADVEEEKPGPDLDELLELLASEPDEKPRRRGTPGWLWLTLGVMLSLGGVWLAFVAARGGATEKKAPLGPPVLPTKVSDRTPRAEKEVVEDYIARCKKGMTSQEVQWIVEDFQKEGLDSGTRDRLWDLVEDLGRDPNRMDAGMIQAATREALRINKQQRRWYLDLLADALKLGKQQREQAHEKCERWFATTEEKFLQLNQRAGGGGTSGYHPIDGFTPYTGLLDASEWLKDDSFAPWALCDLTDDQLAITRYREVMQERNPGQSPDEVPPVFRSWLGQSSASMPGVTREQIEATLLQLKFDEPGSIFPFDAGQQFDESEDDLLKVARKLHPAQLKTLLLLSPHSADELSKLLDQPNE